MKTVRTTVPLDIAAGFGTGVAVGAAVISIESFPPFPYQSLSVHENSRFNEKNARFSVKGAKDVSCQGKCGQGRRAEKLKCSCIYFVRLTKLFGETADSAKKKRNSALYYNRLKGGTISAEIISPKSKR